MRLGFALTPYKQLLAANLAVIFGVALGPLVPCVPTWLVMAGLLACLVTLALRRRREWRWLPAVALVMLAVLAGAWRYQHKLQELSPAWPAENHEAYVELSGRVAREPDRRADHVRYALDDIVLDGSQRSGRVLVRAQPYPAYELGDEVSVRCRLAKPGMIEDFDYGRYLSAFGIVATCSNARMGLESEARGGALRAILWIKQRILGGMSAALPEPHASFAAGLILGVKRGIPPDLQQAFQDTGTTHIVVVSGSNITIVSAVLLSAAVGLGINRRRAFWAVMIGIWVFVFMTGAESSVIRAGIMGTLVVAARSLGRASRMAGALALSAAVMLAINPMLLAADAGFQLSFLSTLGLVYVAPHMDRVAGWLPKRLGLREALVSTLAATAATWALIAKSFGRLSVVSALANLLILPAVPMAMAGGFAAAMIELYVPSLSGLAAWPAWLCLEYMIRVARMLARMPSAAVDVAGFGWTHLICYYALLVSLLAMPMIRRAYARR